MLFPYLACEFGKSTLSNLVKECFGEDFPDIVKKKQVSYIYNYLKDLGAKSVLLEADYVDKDYLEDYSRYYVKCFNRYGERCARLHFFKEEIEHSEFDKAFGEPSKELHNKITDSYLGFIVIKPIPKTFIGKTCLNIYDEILSNPTKSLIKRTYPVNLFGLELAVESIAFQEQDKVLSACATTAIWSVLHAVKDKKIREIPSSSEITLSAINYINNSSNTFPNDGLTNKQILRALDTEKLRHHLINIGKLYSDESAQDRFFKIIKTYIDSEIPIILGADVYEKNNGKLEYLDGHAVSILGYKEDGDERALYLHDDRIGPFARAKIGEISEYVDGVTLDDKSPTWCVALQEKDDDGEWCSSEQILKPESLIVPTDKKVRIQAMHIKNTCRSMVDEYDAYIAELKESGSDVSEFEGCLTYKVRLEELSDVRRHILNSVNVENRRESLTKSAARFLWVAEFTYKGEVAFDILFDATDIPQGRIVSDIIVYNKVHYKASIVPFDMLIKTGRPLPESSELNFLGSFISYLKENECGLYEYLNDKYGELRAPRYLRDEEVEGEQLYDHKEVKKSYGRIDKSLKEEFPDADESTTMIWAISYDGALLIGKEEAKRGHPTLTGFKPSRIAGELKCDTDGNWMINAKSGRYSRDYKNSDELLENAKMRFLEIYSKESEGSITLQLTNQ